MSAIGQQEIMVSQYMFNKLFLNPAYAGTHKYFSSSLLHRSQWVNLDGAPKTYLFAVDGPIKLDKMGIGLVVANDQIGVVNTTDILANYAYQMKVTEKGILSFGIKGGITSYKANLNDLTYWDQNDQVYQQGIVNQSFPKFGFGTYYYTDRFFAGISIPTLLAYQKGMGFSLDVAKSSDMRRHYFINAGYVMDINENFKFKPSFLFKYLPHAPAQIDVNLSLMYKDQVWFGASFRSGDAIVALIEYQANQRIRIGYAYDFTLSQLNQYSNGTHEIMIGYDFGKDIIAVKTPRYF